MNWSEKGVRPAGRARELRDREGTVQMKDGEGAKKKKLT